MSTPAKKKAPTFDPLKTKQAEDMKQKRAGRNNGAKSSKRSAGKDGGKAPPPEPTADLEELKPPFLCFYHDKTGRYYLQDASGCFRGSGIDDVREEMRAHGVSNRNGEGKIISPQGKMLRTVRRCYNTDYAGPLAGHFAGVIEAGGRRLLVTDSPNPPEPHAGDFATLERFLRELFGVDTDPHGATQLATFNLWAARAWRAIAKAKAGKSLLGHALILAGPGGSGKNLLQEVVITTLLGGRVVKAGAFFSGQTEFNGSLFLGEHWMLADENGDRTKKGRDNLKQRFKAAVANELQECHFKGRDPMSVVTRQRVTMSVNDSTEHLETVFTVSDEDVRDKVHLLLCHPADIPANDEARESWVAAIVNEIPAWLHHCLALAVPEDLREDRPRFGAKQFHHPELLERLNAFAPEMHLLALIDRLLEFGDVFDEEKPAEWKGRASDLRAALLEGAKDKPLLEREIVETVRNDERCGQYLKRLSQHEATKDRVQELPRMGSKRGWRILPPAKEDDNRSAVADSQSPRP